MLRKRWKNEKWYFVMADIVESVTGSVRPRKYWHDFKNIYLKDGQLWKIELSEKIGRLKIEGRDGKHYFMDVADTETAVKIAQLLSTQPKIKNAKNSGQMWRNIIKESRFPPTKFDRLTFSR
jgi:hypothetical protein